MPFGLGKMMTPESPGTQDKQHPQPGGGTPPNGTGFGGTSGQPDALNLRAEWRADKVKTRLGKAPGTLAVTAMINQVKTGPDLITKPGFSNPLLLTNIHGAAYAVGQIDVNPPINRGLNQPNGQISTYSNLHFVGNRMYTGWDISLETAVPLYNLSGPACTIYILGSADVYGYGWGTFGGVIGSSGDGTNTNGYWHLNGVTKFNMLEGQGFIGDTVKQLNYNDPTNGSNASGFGLWFTGNNYWLENTVLDMSRTGGALGAGSGQVQPYIDDAIITGPLGTAAANYIYVGNTFNLGPSNALQNATFGLWVPDTSQPTVTPLTAYPGQFSYFNGYPNSAFLDPVSVNAWANTCDPNLSITHVMIYEGTHSYTTRVAVRQYINSIWGHASSNFSVADSGSIPPIY